ncbi:MAG TPA: VIT and VWA domain-containing protein, partial [Pseudomonadota bacterium]|nr:VIT and VWA domain-containing protein [Pseudomonadota bacterium]
MRPPGPARPQGDLGSWVPSAGRRGGLGFGLALACGLSFVTALSSCAPAGNRADEPAAGDRGGLAWLLEGRARADVPPGSRGRPRPSIVWTPVKPLEPELVLAKPAGPPMSLTSSDGTGLQLVALEARAVVEDPLTFTELKLTFRNPQPRQLEGQFEITLPPDAAISRFAMRQGDAWQEGEVVELQAARQAYEDFLHRRQDPALLEKQAGNQFRARVFPIPPSGEKQLIISYSAERPRADAPYRIYLRGLPELARLDIRAIIAKSSAGSGPASSLGGETLSHQTVAVQKQSFRPDVDFEVPVPVPQAADSSAVGLRHQNLVVARISPLPADKQAQTDPLDSVLVLFDTSASRALGWQAQVDALGALVDTLRKEAGPALPLRVLGFDQDVEQVFDGPAGQFGAAQLQRVRERRALGASDLARALRVAAAKKGAPMQRVLLITDGIVTAGTTDAPELRKLVTALSGQGARRLDAITFGGIRDEALLAKLVTAGLPSDGVVIDGETPPQAVARRLQRSTFSGIKVEVPGSPWVWPVQLDGVQPGEQVLVYADLPDGKPFEVTLTDKNQRTERRPVVTVEVARPLLERAWVNARIHRLLNQRDKLAESDPDLGEALKHQIVDLSTKFRVLSDYTALLVLETEQDYARFRIDRRALTDILTIGLNGIEVVNRKNLQPVVVANPPPRIITSQNAAPKDRDGDSGSPGRPPRPSAGKAAAPTRFEPREAERDKRSANSAATESGSFAADESAAS